MHLRPRSPAQRLAWPATLLLATMLALALGWTGYTASDDASYYQGALRWLIDPPWPGDGHWSTRFPIILSLAAALLLLGQGFAALTATALAWYAGLIAVTGLFTARIAGRTAGWIAAVLVATLPVVTSEATTVGCDLAEALFLLAGCCLITGSTGSGKTGRSRPVAAGLCFALAILSRETAALALLGFVPLFLLGRPLPRRTLILMGLAAAALLLGEMAFQWALTGDPLRRYTLAFNHDSHIDRAANLEGNLLIHAAIDPLLVLLVNNDFALLFWFALAALASGVHRGLGASSRRQLLVPAVLAATAFLLIALLTTKLVLNPRYFTLPAIVAVMIVAIWLAGMAVRARAVVLSVTLAANLLMLSVQNAHPRWPAEALVLAAAAHPAEPVLTDRDTRQRAEIPLGFARLTNAQAGPPRPGALYLAPEHAGIFAAHPLARYPSPATPLGRAIEALGLTPCLPAAISRLLSPNPAVLLWRVQAKGPADRSAGP
jgi:hypothetical protein